MSTDIEAWEQSASQSAESASTTVDLAMQMRAAAEGYLFGGIVQFPKKRGLSGPCSRSAGMAVGAAPNFIQQSCMPLSCSCFQREKVFWRGICVVAQQLAERGDSGRFAKAIESLIETTGR